VVEQIMGKEGEKHAVFVEKVKFLDQEFLR